jgi:hypothetical protein
MKTTEPKNNNIKKNRTYLLTFILSVIFTLNIAAKTDTDSLTNEMHKLEKLLFTNVEFSSNKILDINDVKVIELEEEVEIGFDTTKYLPENFNALKGKDDLDWNTIELIEIEEEVEIGFDTSKYLPKDFNALKGKNDLDWSTIELIEIEEEVEIDFDTKAYLPDGFDPYKGMIKKAAKVVIN